MNLILELEGFTNVNLVKCVYNKSPLEFYANIKDDSVLDHQLDILKFAWPNITKNIFLEHVCSSSLEKNVWINRKELIPSHKLKLFIQGVDLQDINFVLNSSGFDSFHNMNDTKDFFDKQTYPTHLIDFIPLIIRKCDPYLVGLQTNTLYYLSKPPVYKFT